MLQIKQSESTAARRRIPVYLTNPSDNYTPKTGVSPAAADLKVSKNGAAESNFGGTFTEVGSGVYYYEATSGELDTFGYLVVRYAGTAASPFIAVAQVVAFDPYVTVQSQVDAALDASNTELSSVPGVTGSLRSMMKFLFTYFKHRRTVTATTETLYKDDGTTSLGTSSVSDNGTTFDKAEMV
jgi:hypothetical protein